MNEFTDLLQSSPPVALALALNVVGLALKKAPVPNWIIPLVLPVLGALLYPFIAEAGKVNFECRNPDVLLGVHGAMIGAGSVGINQMLRQFLGRKEAEEEQPKPKGSSNETV